MTTYEPGQQVHINVDPSDGAYLDVSQGALGYYVEHLSGAIALPYPHRVELNGNYLLLSDEEVQAA